MALTLDDLFASPDHYLHAFEGDAAVFVPMDRAAYHRSIFLDARISPAADGALRMPLRALAGAPRTAAATGWIFHVAHCGSTLLARALDHAATNLVLREPLALRQTALARSPERLALVAALLSKRYAPDLPTIVKANVPVNFLLGELAALDRDARAIFLHLPLADYCLAILRSDNHREWLRRVTTTLAPWLGDLGGYSDAERAGALWAAQMQAFAAAAALLPHARSVDAEAFFARPGPVVAAVAAQLGVPLTPAMIAAAVDGPLFATYSKNPAQRFDNAERLARRAALEAGLAGEIAQAHRRVAGRADAAIAALDAIRLIP